MKYLFAGAAASLFIASTAIAQPVSVGGAVDGAVKANVPDPQATERLEQARDRLEHASDRAKEKVEDNAEKARDRLDDSNASVSASGEASASTDQGDTSAKGSASAGN